VWLLPLPAAPPPQELQPLQQLPSLVDLRLSDPSWGACLVASLANYQTFMLHLLPHLTSLDTLVLAPETKAAAGATWTKKQLFYSMRGRTLRRQLKEVQREARGGLQVRGVRGEGWGGGGVDGRGGGGATGGGMVGQGGCAWEAGVGMV
jgi:hypothetical protein